jgi:hypothetical protein
MVRVISDDYVGSSNEYGINTTKRESLRNLGSVQFFMFLTPFLEEAIPVC